MPAGVLVGVVADDRGVREAAVDPPVEPGERRRRPRPRRGGVVDPRLERDGEVDEVVLAACRAGRLRLPDPAELPVEGDGERAARARPPRPRRRRSLRWSCRTRARGLPEGEDDDVLGRVVVRVLLARHRLDGHLEDRPRAERDLAQILERDGRRLARVDRVDRRPPCGSASGLCWIVSVTLTCVSWFSPEFSTSTSNARRSEACTVFSSRARELLVAGQPADGRDAVPVEPAAASGVVSRSTMSFQEVGLANSAFVTKSERGTATPRRPARSSPPARAPGRGPRRRRRSRSSRSACSASRVLASVESVATPVVGWPVAVSVGPSRSRSRPSRSPCRRPRRLRSRGPRPARARFASPFRPLTRSWSASIRLWCCSRSGPGASSSSRGRTVWLCVSRRPSSSRLEVLDLDARRRR